MGDLLGDDLVPTAKPKRTRKLPASDGSVQRCFDAFSVAFIERWNMKPDFVGGRDGKLFKELCAQYGVDVVVETLIPELFRSTNYHVVSSDYSVPALRRNAQALVLDGRRPTTDARTLSNLDAAARAMGRKR